MANLIGTGKDFYQETEKNATARIELTTIKQYVMKSLRTAQIICATIILVTFVSACKKHDSLDSIDSAINIKMWEAIDSTQRTMKLYCSTVKHYPCFNYGIGSNHFKNSDGIIIDFDGIVIPEMCLTAFGPASTTIDLGTVSNGTYNFEINVNSKKSTGTFIVSSDYYKIVLDRQRDLQMSYTVLNRIPNGTIWGTIGYHTASSATIAQSFIDSIISLGASTQAYNAGEYGYFKTDLNGQILPPTNHGYYFIRPFIYHYTGNTHDLKNTVKNYGQNHGDLLKIRLYTTNGEVFRSWMQ